MMMIMMIMRNVMRMTCHATNGSWSCNNGWDDRCGRCIIRSNNVRNSSVGSDRIIRQQRQQRCTLDTPVTSMRSSCWYYLYRSHPYLWCTVWFGGLSISFGLMWWLLVTGISFPCMHHSSNIVVSVYREHHFSSSFLTITYFQLVLGMEMRESLPSQVTIVSTVLLMNKIPMLLRTPCNRFLMEQVLLYFLLLRHPTRILRGYSSSNCTRNLLLLDRY